VVEGRQQQPPRGLVRDAVDRQQAVADQRDQVAHRALAPDEVLRVRDEHVVVRLGADHHRHGGVQDADREDGAVLLVEPHQLWKRLDDDPARADDARPHFPARERHGRGALALHVDRDPAQRIGRHRRREHCAHGARVVCLTWHAKYRSAAT
jgi:hypothetical protein